MKGGLTIGGMRRSAWSVLIAGILAVALPASATAETRILACEPEWAALAREIGGSDVVVHSATHAQQDAHYIRARPGLIARIRRADILFCSGADLEAGWLPVLLKRGARLVVQHGQPGNIMASDYVRMLEVPENLDRSHGHVHPAGNPHVHLDPENIGILARILTERLVLIDPDNADGYRSRHADFTARWDKAAATWRSRAEKLQGMKVIVHHTSWPYLLQWTGLDRVIALEVLPGVSPTASHLAQVLDRVSSSDTEAILLTPFEPRDAAEWVSARSGVPVVDLPFTVGGREGVDDLFSLFDVTLELLEGARG